MTEPTYIYQKGQGWVLTMDLEDWYEAVTKDGTLIQFQFAVPKKGDGWYCKPKSAKCSIEDWRTHIRWHTIDFLMEPADERLAQGATRDTYFDYIVIRRAE